MKLLSQRVENALLCEKRAIICTLLQVVVKKRQSQWWDAKSVLTRRALVYATKNGHIRLSSAVKTGCPDVENRHLISYHH